MKLSRLLNQKKVSQTVSRVVVLLAAVILLASAVSCGLNDLMKTGNESAPEGICVDGEELRSLNDFLSRFVGRYPVTPDGKWEYDSSAAVQGSNILACIATPASCADWSLYSDIPAEDCFVERTDDPRGWSAETYAYYVYDGETVEFIAREIFNVSDNDILRLIGEGERDRLFYKENGRYYTLYEGVLDSYSDINIVSVTPLDSDARAEEDNHKYSVTFTVNGVVNKNESDELTLVRGSRSAEVEMKHIGGSEYWSLYSFH